MIIGIGRPNGTSALHRLAPIADSFALRCRSVDSRPLCHPRFRPGIANIHYLRDITFRSGDPNAAPGPTANHRIPIAV